MKREKRAILKATSTMVGFMIGVGIFGVPFAVSKSGYLVGLFYLLGVGFMLLVTHYFYSDVVVNTSGKHRLVGYAREHLGPRVEKFTWFSSILGIMGGIIAYFIIGGEFLYNLLSPSLGGDIFQYQVGFFIIASFAVLMGLRVVSFIEVGMTALLLVVMGIIFMHGIPRVEVSNLFTFGYRDLFLPYGVVLFALSGINAIPEIRDVLKRYSRDMRLVIAISTILVVALTIIFTFVVVGNTGAETSSEAISGLAVVWGDWILYFGSLFGFLAIATSILITMTNLKECFIYDLKVGKYLSWFIVCFVPFLIFLMGAQSFIGVIGFTGAIFGGLNGIIIAIMYLKLRKKKKPLHPVMKWPVFIPYLIMFAFGLGILYEIIYKFINGF